MLLLLCNTTPAVANAQADSARSSITLFTYRDAILAGGVLSLALLAQPADEQYAARLQDSSTQANRRLHTLAKIVRTTTAPGAYIIGTSMYALGRVSRSTELAEIGLHGTEALIVGELTGTLLKTLIGRQRPHIEPRNSHSYQFLRGAKSDDYRSLPSGHTLAAFAAAAAVTSEVSGFWPKSTWIVAPVLFGGAATVGASRMYDNRHWLSDVIIGAGIGTFAGLKVVRYHHTNAGNKVDRWFLGASLVPTNDGGRTVRWSLIPASFNRVR